MPIRLKRKKRLALNPGLGRRANLKGGNMIEIKNPIEIKVKTILSNILGVPYADIMLTSKLKDNLGADSLDGIEIVQGLEMEFRIDVPDYIAERFVIVGDLVEYITMRT